MTNEQLLFNLAKKFSDKREEYANIALGVEENIHMTVYYGSIVKAMEESALIILEVLKENK